MKRDGYGGLPRPHRAVAQGLAKTAFKRFFHHNPDAALTEVEIRFCRRYIFDRGEFDNMKYAFRAKKGGTVALGGDDEPRWPGCNVTEEGPWFGYVPDTSPEALPM